MIHNYIVTFKHNVWNNDLLYEVKHKNKIIRYEIIFGYSPYLELIYYFSLMRIHSSLIKEGETYTMRLTFTFNRYYKSFEESLFEFLFSHGCTIV